MINNFELDVVTLLLRTGIGREEASCRSLALSSRSCKICSSEAVNLDEVANDIYHVTG